MNSIIVESKNDMAFFMALITHLNLSNTEIDQPILLESDDCFELNGLDQDPKNPTLFIRKFKEFKTDIFRKDIERVGIIIDKDFAEEKDRFELINNGIIGAFEGEDFSLKTINSQNEPFQLDYQNKSILIYCHFLNINGYGNLDNVLRKIACKPSDFADCLIGWKACLIRNGKEISQNNFNKFWVSNYIRFDTCSTKERKQAGRKCSFQAFEYVMEKKHDIFDLDSSHLSSLKSFLALFN